MVPLIFEVPDDDFPARVLAETWETIRRSYPGECGTPVLEPPVPPGIVRVTLPIPVRVQAYIACLDALTTINVWARRRWDLPTVYSGRLRYVPEPPGFEIWASSPALYVRGVGDCEDIAADRVAELQIAGVPARTILRLEESRGDVKFWHVLVALPDGTIEDPCFPLGMK